MASEFKKILVIGCSRGLGFSLLRFIPEHFNEVEKIVAVSRKAVSPMARSADDLSSNLTYEFLNLDMSKSSDQEELCGLIADENFDLVIYAAGGGPHGDYASKDWKDHQWALEVGLVAPMKLCLQWLKSRNQKIDSHQSSGRFVIVGSRVAGLQPDPKASSYAAAKHGLVGFVSSLQDELAGKQSKVWLFSPGYMDTEMLPQTAAVRHNGTKLLSPDTAAQALFRWVKKEGPWHRVIG